MMSFEWMAIGSRVGGYSSFSMFSTMTGEFSSTANPVLPSVRLVICILWGEFYVCVLAAERCCSGVPHA